MRSTMPTQCASVASIGSPASTIISAAPNPSSRFNRGINSMKENIKGEYQS
jgi:hypothetical protein